MLARKKILGDYNIGKTIGQGAFSKVKIGYHIETGQKVAIKVIDKKQMEAKAKKAKEAHEERERKKQAKNAVATPSGTPAGTPAGTPGGTPTVTNKESKLPPPATESKITDDAGSVEGKTTSFVSSLQTEVQLLMRLDHPNVIRLYQVMDSEDECFVVMEYASGGELIDYIAAKGNLTEKEARKYFRQMVSALDHCHMAGVVHRDLKLENLLLNSERNLLISDFGLGRTFDTESEELMKTFCGTPNYAAAELISGIPYVGVKSDIWAMGVVLYVMMTGRPPFIGENISALYSKIKAVDYKCPSYFSLDLRHLLAKLLVRDPKLRADMDTIRQDPWVNYEEIELPRRVFPKVIVNTDSSQIGQFISGIHHDQSFTIYTFRSHTLDVDRFAEIKKQAQRRQSKINAENSRVSTADDFRGKPSPVGGDTATPSSLPSTVRRRMSLGGGTYAIPHESKASPTVINGSSSKARRLSVFASDLPVSPPHSPPPTIKIDGEEFEDELRPIAMWSSSTVSKSRSLNRPAVHVGTTLSAPVGKTGVSPSPSPNSGRRVRRNTLTVLNTAIPTPAVPDRDFSVIRRMSQVSPINESLPGNNSLNPDQHQKKIRRGSLSPQMLLNPVYNDRDLQASSGALRKNKNTQSGPDDLDPMVETGDYLPDIEEPEITTKEIEEWHMLHKPPKQIRTVRFTFNSSTTSNLAPFQVFQEVHRVLLCLQKQYNGSLTFTRMDDLYLLNCKLDSENKDNAVEFEVEVCKLWLLKLHGVRIKRISGNPFIFKDIYTMFVSLLRL